MKKIKTTTTLKEKVLCFSLNPLWDNDGAMVLQSFEQKFNTKIYNEILLFSIIGLCIRYKADDWFCEKVASEKNILSDQNHKIHPSLEQHEIDMALSDVYSQMMPGQTNYVTVKIDGVKIQRQYRLILNNFKELHRLHRPTWDLVFRIW